VQLADGLLFGTLAAAVVAGSGVGIGVTHELLHRGDVGAGIDQITGKGATEVVR